MNKITLLAITLCLFKMNSFADIYSIMNQQERDIQISIQEAPTHDVVQLVVNPLGGINLGILLAEDGKVVSPTNVIKVSPKQAILLKTIYNYNEGDNPTLLIQQETTSDQSVKLSNKPVHQDLNSFKITQEDWNYIDCLKGDYSKDLLNILRQSDHIVIIESQK